MFSAILLFILCAPAFSYNISNKNRPNVLFVISDDLRPTISGYGDPLAITPNIDKFMQKSFFFTKAYCQQSLCAPSRNSILTSRRPDTLHLYDFYNYWRTFTGNFTTLPQYFKDNNYFTYSIGKIFHPGVSSNFNDDFPLSWSQRAFHPSTEKYMNSPVCSDGSGELKADLICPVRVKAQPKKTLPDIESLEEAKRFLKSRKNLLDPFFLAVGFHKPHIPFRFPQKLLRLFPITQFNTSSGNFKPNGMPNVAWNPFNDIRSRDDVKQLNISFPFGPIPADYRALIRQAYYCSVAYVDSLFGELLENVDLNNTIVVLIGDHGWSLGEHAEWAKYSNFEIAVRVPLIIYSPKFNISKSRKVAQVVELVDIFPTIVDLAGLTRVQSCQRNKNEETCTEGESLYEMIKFGRAKKRRVALSQYPRPGPYPSQQPDSDKPKLKEIKIMGYSIRSKNFRYTAWVRFNPHNFTKDWEQLFGEELYDHRIDSDENINLIGRPFIDSIQKRLKERLIQEFSCET